MKTTSVSRCRRFLRRNLLFLLLVLSCTDVFASHFRHRTITWARVPGNPYQIKFTINEAWRTSAFGATVGSTVGTSSFTPNGSTFPTVNLAVTSVNASEDWFYGTYTYTHTYPSVAATYVANCPDNCCRIGGLGNNNGGSFYTSTTVTVGNNNDAPVSTIPPIINLPTNLASANYQIPAADPDGDAISYALTANGAFGSGTVQPGGISITSGGLLSFNTVGKAVGSLWNAAVTITDAKGATVMVDFIIRITNTSTPPTFDYAVTPANNFNYLVQPGQAVNFNVKAGDNDAGDNVALSAVGVPVGATFTPNSGNPVTNSFSWTPTSGQLGTYLVNFIAQDNAGIQTNTIVKITVSLKPKFDVPPTPGNGSVFCAVPGVNISETFRASDPDAADLVVLSAESGVLSGMAFSPALPTAAGNPASTSFSWTPAANQWGHKILVLKATDTYNEVVRDSINYLVNHKPVVTSATPTAAAYAGQLYSYTIVTNDDDIPYGDEVGIESHNLPSWLSITDNNNGTFTLSGTPSVADSGEYEMEIEFEDELNHILGTHCGHVHYNFDLEVIAAPMAFNVTGGGSFCFGSGGVPVGLNGSETGVNYQLYVNGNSTGSAIAGTGNAISFGNQVTNGTYTVVATRAGGGSSSTMNGDASINAPSAPLTFVPTPTNPVCGDANSGSISVSGTGGLAPYQYNLNGGTYGSSNTFSGLGAGSYQVNIRDAAGCVSLSQNVGIIKPFCSVAVNDSFNNCSPNSIQITLAQLIANDVIAAGDTVSIGDWGTPSVGSVSYNSNTKTFTYTPPANYNGPATFTYTIKRNDNTLAFGGNGHFYEFVNAYSITWHNARAQAQTRYYNGMQGYLVTVTSAAENTFVQSKLAGQGWMGASDLNYEGTWRWVTGPEGLENGGLGRHFSNQFKYANCGASQAPGINGNYSSWNGGEPNDCGANVGQFVPTDVNRGGEHYAHYLTNGLWNDYPNNAGGNIAGYVVEYGGAEISTPVVTTSTATISINNIFVTAYSVTGGGNYCSGDAGVPVMLSGSQTGINYQLRLNGNNVGGPVAGTGAAISFGNQTGAGTYTVVATSAIGNCSKNMTGTSVVNIQTKPVFTACPSNINANTSSTTCDAVVNYAAAATGTPAASISYSFSGATTGSGSGTGSGSTFNIGVTNVTVTATNICGSVTCDFTITVSDATPPTAICQNVTVQLDATGNGSITASQLDNGSNDACGVAGVSASQTSFDCSNVGANTVTLTVTDVNGNSSTCDATVTVEDNVAPVAVCKNITVQLDANGNVNITGADVDNGSNDACGVAGLSVSPGSFTCANIGDNSVTLTVTDNNGNTSTCGATVTVQDNVAPVAVCKNITVQLDNTGNTGITANDVDNGSNDACGIAGISVDKTSFDCSNVGANTVTLKVTDNNGNVSTCDATVTVEDNVAPVAMCKNVTVELDASGNGSITTSDIDNGSNDACGVASLALSKSSFDCSNVGANTVVLTVTDNNGNAATCNAIVTVNDNVAPVAMCKNYTLNLSNGTGTVLPGDIDNGSYDACGIASMTVTPNTFICANAGQNTVTLKVTDNNGNVSSCNATVTVQYQPTCNISVTPANNTYTGGVSTNIYLGYGPQSATITANAAGGSGFTYSWYPSTGLSCSNCQSPVFTPTSGGLYTYTVTVTNSNGCKTTCTVTFCVKDIREKDKNGKHNGKVFICHAPPGNPANANTLSISVNAVPSHLGQHSDDRLGACDQGCGTGAKDGTTANNEGNDLGEMKELKVYPNPTSGTFYVELPGAVKGGEAVITDMNGRLIERSTFTADAQLKFNLGYVAKGVYMIHIVNDKDSYRARIVIQE